MTMTSAQTVLAIACAAWWMLSLSVHLLSAVLALIQPMLARRNSRPDQPPVSVLVPVKEADPELDAAFVSVFSQTYPQFEVLISADDGSLPALAIGREITARFPQIESRAIVSNKRVTVSPKLNNLAAPLEQARNDLVLLKDSNVRLAPGQLAEFVHELGPGIGLVSAAKIANEPANFAAEIECAFMNGYQGRLLLAASALGMRLGIGACMLFDRREFARAGGLEGITAPIGVDHALAKAMARIGWRTILSGSVAEQPLQRRRWSAVWNRQLRWMMSRRSGEPLAFLAEPFFGAPFTLVTGAIGAAVLGVPIWVMILGTLGVWLLTEAVFLKIKGWHCPRSAPWPWLCREFLVLALWIRAWSTTSVVWGGVSLPVRGSRP